MEDGSSLPNYPQTTGVGGSSSMVWWSSTHFSSTYKRGQSLKILGIDNQFLPTCTQKLSLVPFSFAQLTPGGFLWTFSPDDLARTTVKQKALPVFYSESLNYKMFSVCGEGFFLSLSFSLLLGFPQ